MIGETVLGRFTLQERVGAGGFGVVYRAWDERLQRAVAVKAIEARGEARRRVLREAQAAARLNHRSIVTLYELGSEANRAYLVSELAEGMTLREAASGSQLSDRDVAELGLDLCEALQHAHERGVVHRDLKPQNVVVCRDPQAPMPRAKLMDFGTAALADEPSLTATGEVVGTIAYMAPEQAAGAGAGAPADVYSLALTLYEAWSGRNPVLRESPAATARAIGHPVAPLEERRPELPRELCASIDACLASQPEARPSLDELAVALGEALHALDDSDPVPVPETARPRPRSGGIVATVARLVPVLLLAGAIAALIAAERAGAALVVAALALPAALVLPRPGQCFIPALAPLLGAAGLAPVYPALAGLAGSVTQRVALSGIGWAALAVADVTTATSLSPATLTPAPAGWSGSASEAFTGVLLPLLTPGSLLLGVAWVAAALLLGLLLRGRTVALQLLGALVWAAGVIAIHRLLAGGATEPGGGLLAAALVALVGSAVWVRAGRRPPEWSPGDASLSRRIVRGVTPPPA